MKSLKDLSKFSERMKKFDVSLLDEIRSNHQEKLAITVLDGLLLENKTPLSNEDHIMVCTAINGLRTKELYEKYGVYYILKQLTDEHEADIVSVHLKFPQDKSLTDKMAEDLINAVKEPWQIKAINTALIGASEDFQKEFQATLNKNQTDTLLWFHCMAIVATAEEKYQLRLSDFEQKFVIPKQIEIAKRTIANMTGRPDKTRCD